MVWLLVITFALVIINHTFWLMNGISFRHGSLFSGIGGFDYASSLMGWENVFHCELNPFCRQVLKYHYPNSVSYEDITKTDFSVYRGRIDIITGGFPCQPYSLAGKRLGKDDERHLWPQMLRVIREVSPKWIVGENVFGIVNWSGGLVFEEVQADLEREGYEVQSYILPAAGVDAPHKRDRVWFVGYAKHNGRFASKVRRDEQESSFKAWENEVREFKGADSVQSSSGIVAYSNDKGGGDGYREVQESDGEVSKRNDHAKLSDTGNGITQNSNEDGRGGDEWESKSCIGQQRNIGSGDNERLSSDNAEAGIDASDTSVKRGRWELQQRQEQGESGGCNSKVTDASDTNFFGHSSCGEGEEAKGVRCENNGEPENGEQQAKWDNGFLGLQFDASDTSHTRLQGSKEFRSVRECRKEPHEQPPGCFFSNWQNFPTQSPICFGNDGISSDTYTETVSKEHTMDRDIVIKKALEQGRLVADHQTGKIYSTTLRGRNGEKVELPGSDCNGYRVHNIYVDGIKKQCRAHQIVWISANGLYDKKKLMIDHINRDRSDNRLSNLRLVDSKGNAENAERWKGNFSQNEKDLMHELHTNGHMSFMELAEHFECSKSRVHQIVSEHNGIYGISFPKWRNESIKAAGNAVVPQVVLQIFKAIQAYEDSI